MNQAPPPISSLRPDVPSGLGRIVMKCLEKDPNERYQFVDEVFAELCKEQKSLEFWKREYQKLAERTALEHDKQPGRIWLAAGIIAAFFLLPLFSGPQDVRGSGWKADAGDAQFVSIKSPEQFNPHPAVDGNAAENSPVRPATLYPTTSSTKMIVY